MFNHEKALAGEFIYMGDIEVPALWNPRRNRWELPYYGQTLIFTKNGEPIGTPTNMAIATFGQPLSTDIPMVEEKRYGLVVRGGGYKEREDAELALKRERQLNPIEWMIIEYTIKVPKQ